MSIGRREVLAGVFSSVALFGTSPAFARALVATPERRLSFRNLHTGEKLTTAFWADGAYVPESLRQIDWLLRDHRTDAAIEMAPGLLDLLHALARTLEIRAGFSVISGYRSPQTNAKLAAAGTGVVRNSLHTRGMAIDVRVEGVPLARLRDAAKSLRLGGVGFYPRSGFVHVDIGRVRSW